MHTADSWRKRAVWIVAGALALAGRAHGTDITGVVPAVQVDPTGGAAVTYENPNFSTRLVPYCNESFAAVAKATMTAANGFTILDFESGSGFGAAPHTLAAGGTAFTSTTGIAPWAATDALGVIGTTDGRSVTCQYRTLDNTYQILSGSDATQGVFLVHDRAANDTTVSGVQGVVAGQVFASVPGGASFSFDRNLTEFGVVVKSNSSASPTVVVQLYDGEGTLIARYSQGIGSGTALFLGVRSPGGLIRSAWVGQSTASNGLVIDDLSFRTDAAHVPAVLHSWSFAGSTSTNGWFHTSGATPVPGTDYLTINGASGDAKIYQTPTMTLTNGADYVLSGTGSGNIQVLIQQTFTNSPAIRLDLNQASGLRNDHVRFTAPATLVNPIVVVQVSTNPGTAEIQALKLASAPSRTPYAYTNGMSATNSPSVVRGMNSNWSNTTYPGGALSTSYFTDMKGWGCNMVRLQIHPTAYASTHSGDFMTDWPNYKAMVVQSVANAEAVGLKVVVDLHEMPFTNSTIDPWQRDDLSQRFCTVWRDLLLALQPYASGIWGYEILNEPQDSANQAQLPRQWWPLVENVRHTIRTIDPNAWIVYDTGLGGQFDGFAGLQPFVDSHIVYSAHCYYPMDFTHQGVLAQYPTPRPYNHAGDIGGMDAAMSTAVAFQGAYGANIPIYVGEFSAARWGPGAAGWLGDVTSYFEYYHWSWSYFAFREFQGWDLERVDTPMSDTSQSPTLTDRGAVIQGELGNNSP